MQSRTQRQRYLMNRRRSDNHLKHTSKFISLILRHNPGAVGITLDEHGWANVQELIDGINRSDDYILDMEKLEESTPPEVLWHGTGEKYVSSIDRQGLIPKSRLYVHLSSDMETARKVGSRHGRPVIYQVDCRRMVQDGYSFFLSANKVWLTKEVPARYLSKAGQE